MNKTESAVTNWMFMLIRDLIISKCGMLKAPKESYYGLGCLRGHSYLIQYNEEDGCIYLSKDGLFNVISTIGFDYSENDIYSDTIKALAKAIIRNEQKK